MPGFLQTRTVPLTLSAVEEAGALSGTAAAWGVENANGVLFKSGAFADWLTARTPAFLWQHDETQPIGKVTSATETDAGLSFTAELNLDTARGREAHSLLRQGALTGVSMGVLPLESEPVDGVLHVSKGELWELSLVTFPAEPTARVATVSARALHPNIARARRALYETLTRGARS